MDGFQQLPYLSLLFIIYSVHNGRLEAIPTSLSLNGTKADNTSGVFCPVLDDGQNITCVIDHGDQSGNMWVEQSYNTPDCTTHQYSTTGIYQATAYCTVENKVFNDTVSLYIGESITNVTVGDSYNSTFLAVSLNNNIQILISFATGTDVTVNATDNDLGTNVLLVTNASSSDIYNVDVIKNAIGQYIFEINLSNVVSSVTLYVIVAVEEKILGFSSPSTFSNILLVHETVDVQFTLTSGTHVATELTTGNSSSLLDKCSGQLRSYNFTFTLNDAGIYNVLLVLSNFVNLYTHTIPFNVQYPVNNITANATKRVILKTDTDDFNIAMLSDALFPMGNLSATLDFGGTMQEIPLDTLSPGQIITISSGPHIPDVYQVFVYVHSELTSLNFTWTEVVENPVQSLEFLYAPKVALAEGTQQIGVRITDSNVSPLLNLKCVFTVDGSTQEVVFNLTDGVDGNITVQYTKDGNITIEYNCSTQLTWQADVAVVNTYTDCFKQARLFDPVYKDKAKAVKVYTTDVNSITGKVEVDESCQNSSRKYWWDLKQVYQNGTEILKQYYTFEENQPNSIVISFARESTESGLYSLHLTVNLTDVPGGYIKDYLYIEFIYPDFVTHIAGGTQIEISFNASLKLDAQSNTEDIVTVLTDKYYFDWTCKKINTTREDITALIANFNNGQTSVLDSIGDNCSVPAVPREQAGVITVLSAVLDPGYWHIYNVKVTKGSRNAEGIQAVYVSEGIVPRVSINCSRNCLSKISRDTRLVLDAICVECNGRPTVYTWTIQKFNDTLNKFQTITDVSTMVESELTSNALGIKAQSLDEDSNYNFKLTVDNGSPYKRVSISYHVKINQPPYNGACSIIPLEGYASRTMFTVKCENWLDEGYRQQRDLSLDANEYMKYTLMQRRNHTLFSESIDSILSISSESLITSRLNIGDPDNDYETDIIVRITDSFNGYTDQYLKVKVKNPLDNFTRTTEGDTAEIASFISQVITEAELTNDAGIIIQSAETIISVLNLQIVRNRTTYIVEDQPSDWKYGLPDATENDTLSYTDLMANLQKKEVDKIQDAVKEGIRNLTGRMITQLQEGNTSTYSMISMSSLAFANAVRNNDFVSPQSAIDASTALQMLANSFTNLTHDVLKKSILSSTPEIESTANSLLSLASNLINTTIPSNLDRTYFAMLTENIAFARKIIDFEVHFNGDKAYAVAENSKITPEERSAVYRLKTRIAHYELHLKRVVAADTSPAVIDAIDLIKDSLLKITCKTCEDKFSKSNVDLLLTKNDMRTLENKILKLENNNFSFTIGTHKNSETITKFSIVSLSRSLYIYGSNLADASSITSRVNKLDITDDNDLMIKLDKVVMIQPTEMALMGYYEPKFTEGDASKMFYHVFFYRRLHDSVCFNLIPSIPFKVSTYEVFVRQDNYPTHLTYSAKTYVAPERDWMACIGPEYLKTVGKAYIGLRPTPITVAGRRKLLSTVAGRRKLLSTVAGRRKLLSTGTNETDPSLTPYNFTVITSACTSWDENQKIWDGNPCQMDWFPAKDFIECKCRPTKEMTFGNTFFVAPNTIDFSTVFLKFSPLNQAAILGTLSVILILYVVLIIWARHQDNKDQLKWGVTPLVDNFVDDTYYYLITVYTGMRRGAGTRSKIGFIVSGTESDSGIRELYDGVRRDISTGSVMYFLMAVSEPLGDLDYIYIWHDNSGGAEKASWYLNRIDIEDIQNRERTVFLCGRWLAVENGDGAIDAVMPACGKENLSTFQNMFFINAKDNLSNSHMWVSIFYRPTSSTYTRVQRVSCAFVFILLTMIANAMYFSPEDEFENPHMVRVGSFVFSLQEVYISIVCALISTPATLFVIILFKKTKPRRLDHDVRNSASKYKVPILGNWMDSFMKESKDLEQALVAKGVTDADETILPFWCVYIAWILVAAGTLVPAFFILLFSMQWGKQKSEMWLSRFILSFFESSFLLDPLKVVMMSIVFAIIFKQREKFKPTGLDREIVLKNYRQKFGQKAGFRIPSPPLSPESIQKARDERKRDIKMLGSIKEVAITIVFLWIVFSISYSNRDDRSYLIHQNIVNQIMDPVEKTQPKFTEIKNTEQLIKWLNWTAFPALFPETEFNSDKLHWRWRQYFSDLTNYRVGPPRLRQLRVGKRERVLPEFGKSIYYPGYDFITENSDDLCFAWTSPPCDKEKETYSFSNGAWRHTSAWDIWGIPVLGLYSTYGGGGYIAELDVNWSFSNLTLQELSNGLWFDRQTRAVFLEFVLYSPSANIFTYNFFAAEFPDTGGVIKMYSIYPLRIYQHHGSQGIYVIFCEVIFVVFLILLLVRIIWRFVQFKKQYFKDAWRTLDLICLLFGIIGIVMNIGRLLLANQTMSKFESDPKAFVNFQHIAIWDLLLVVLLGTLVFLATMRLLGILGYDKRIGEVFRVFNNCAYELFWFGILFFYLFITYATLGYLLFGRDLNSYSDIIESLSTLFISMIGKSRFSEIEESDPIMSKFYFFTFIIFLVYFMLTMFLAILCDSINRVHQWTKTDRSDELIDYLIDKFKQLTSIKQTKQSPEKDLDFSSIPEGRITYVSLLNDLRETIHSAYIDIPPQKKKRPLPPSSESMIKRKS